MGLLREKQQPICQCLNQNVVVESFVIILTLVAGIAITGWNLVTFDIVIVPKNADHGNSSGNDTSPGMNLTDLENYKTVDKDIKHLLEMVFLHTNIGITAVFVIEILLKIITLRKTFCKNPFQVLDGIIVIGCAAFQVVFRLISIPDIYYCCSYLIVARLWRTCSVCNIRARRMKEEMEKDIEHRITDHLRTRQRCVILENISLQQENQIKELQAGNLKLAEYQSKRDVRRTSLHPPSDDIQNNNSIESLNGISYYSQIDFTKLKQIEMKRPPPTENMYELYPHSHTNPKPRWRRSSTNEYLERRLSSHTDLDNFSHTATPQKASPSNLQTYQTTKDSASLSPSVDYHTDTLDDTDGKPDNASSHGSETSSTQDVINRKCQFKRQNSCPDYAFTRHMKMTRYESMLVGDNSVNDGNPSHYHNEGFSPEDGIPMSVLSIHSESLTYRSQDGIPTTDL